MQYVVNTVSAVVHEQVCGHGPMRRDAVPTYAPVPEILLDHLPSRLICRWCSPGLLKRARLREMSAA